MKRLIVLATLLVLLPNALFAQSDSTTWRYSEVSDPMQNNTLKVATIYSQNKIELKSPYDGGTTAFIQLVNIPRPNGKPAYHLIFGLTRGQIGSALLQYKFDRANALYWSAQPLTDDNSQVQVAFSGLISSGVKEVNKFVQSGKLIVAVTVYDDGLEYFYFDTSNLDLSRLD